MITFFGDVALMESLKCNYQPETPYIFNLEYVLGNTENLKKQCDKINLSSEFQDFTALFGKKPIAVSVANNHAFDFGQPGFDMTVENLKKSEIGRIGGQAFDTENGTCVLAYSMLEENKIGGGFYLDRERVLKDIAEARKRHENCCIVVMIHWGIENDSVENAEQTETAHWLIDNGADLIIGHHPHCIQSIEQYKGKYVFYSLGNTLFGNMNQQSHFDENGTPHRKYRIKWQKWNRKSLAVVFDEESKTVKEIVPLCQSRKGVVSKASFRLSKYDAGKKHPFDQLVFTLRKYYLFLVSNSFIDGKLFDLQAVLSELKN